MEFILMRSISLIVILFFFTNITAQQKYFSLTGFNSFTGLADDTRCTKNMYLTLNTGKTGRHSYLNITWQLVVGSATAAGCSIIPWSIGFAEAWSGNSSPHSQTLWGVLTLVSYTFGAGLGVYWVSHVENPAQTLWGTIGYAAIGSSTAILTVALLSAKYTTIPGPITILAVLCPVISSILYGSFVADWPQSFNSASYKQIDFAHNELFESEKLFDMQLIRIMF